jgi:hypothetical protein
MAKQEKLLERAVRSPDNLRFGDFETLLRLSDWVFEHQRASHRIWISPTGFRLSVQKRKGGKAKAYQVRQFLDQYENEASHE